MRLLARTGGASRFIFEQHLCPLGSKSVDTSFERSRVESKVSGAFFAGGEFVAP